MYYIASFRGRKRDLHPARLQVPSGWPKIIERFRCMLPSTVPVTEPRSKQLQKGDEVRDAASSPRNRKRVVSILRGQAPFLAVAIQFGLIVLLVHGFHLESLTFARLMVLTFAGFFIHHYLPLRFRLPFFALLSLAGTMAVAHMQMGLVLVAIGMVLIGVCHLPIRYWARVALIGVIGAVLTAARGIPTGFRHSKACGPFSDRCLSSGCCSTFTT